MAVVDGGGDRDDLHRGAARAQVLLPAGYMRHALLTAIVLTAAIYFPLAYYFSVSHTEVPLRDDVAVVYRVMSTGTPGTVAAHMWLPNHVTKASVYENGLLLGEASTVYDDPGRTFSYDGKRWKYVEFSGRIGTTSRYWVVFR